MRKKWLRNLAGKFNCAYYLHEASSCNLPKTTWWSSSMLRFVDSVMKNCDPFVSAPSFAIDNNPENDKRFSDMKCTKVVSSVFFHAIISQFRPTKWIMFYKKIFILKFWAVNGHLSVASTFRSKISSLHYKSRNYSMKRWPFVSKS